MIEIFGPLSLAWILLLIILINKGTTIRTSLPSFIVWIVLPFGISISYIVHIVHYVLN